MTGFTTHLVELIFLIAIIFFSVIINRIFIKYATNLGIRNIDQEPVIRWGSRSKPSLGGISFFILFLISISFYSVFSKKAINFNYQTAGIVSAATLAFCMGLADDAYNTRPFLKFFVQLFCGIILIVSGVYIHFFSYEVFNYALTIFWVLGLMNSINMLDNMDGITAVVSIGIICSVLFMNYSPLLGSSMLGYILLATLGALLGFLYFNWNPSKMYMGDSGSQFLGLFLAAIGIIYIWNPPAESAHTTAYQTILNVAMVFLLPITDTTCVTIKRMLKGNSPFVGGKDHTTHCLAYLGLSDRKVAIVFASISFILMFLFVQISQSNMHQQVYLLISSMFVVVVFLSLFYVTLILKKPAEKE